MKRCCIKTEAERFVRERFRIMEEGEGFTCRECGTIYRIVKGKWEEAPPSSSTVGFYSPTEKEFDLGWATVVRGKGTLTVTCWGCGQTNVYKEQGGLTEVHFDHATEDCTIEKALVNRQRGVMPSITKH